MFYRDKEMGTDLGIRNVTLKQRDGELIPNLSTERNLLSYTIFTTTWTQSFSESTKVRKNPCSGTTRQIGGWTNDQLTSVFVLTYSTWSALMIWTGSGRLDESTGRLSIHYYLTSIKFSDKVKTSLSVSYEKKPTYKDEKGDYLLLRSISLIVQFSRALL